MTVNFLSVSNLSPWEQMFTITLYFSCMHPLNFMYMYAVQWGLDSSRGLRDAVHCVLLAFNWPEHVFTLDPGRYSMALPQSEALFVVVHAECVSFSSA